MPANSLNSRMGPIIGITTYGLNEQPIQSDHYADHYVLPAQYVAAVRRAGGVPVLLAPGELGWERWLDVVDGMVVSGGQDIEPARYGVDSHPDVRRVDPDRDNTELALATRLARSSVAALFICRGMQILNVALGGSLHPHIPKLDGGDIHRSADGLWTYHDIEALEGSLLASAMGATAAKPCSGHHQALDRIAEALTVTATAPDGLAEAVEVFGHPWLMGVQWHPEVSAATDPTQQGIFDAFVKAAAAD
jgi:putative glutamine amidotransferase